MAVPIQISFAYAQHCARECRRGALCHIHKCTPACKKLIYTEDLSPLGSWQLGPRSIPSDLVTRAGRIGCVYCRPTLTGILRGCKITPLPVPHQKIQSCCYLCRHVSSFLNSLCTVTREIHSASHHMYWHSMPQN